jgi:hypothetical protein
VALLGEHPMAVLCTAVAVIGGLAAGRARRDVVVAGVAVAVAVAVVWLVLQPADLYPRFVVWLVPAVALACGRGVGRWPALAAPVAVGVVAAAVSVAPGWTDDPLPLRRAAAFVSAAQATAARTCSLGYGGEALAAYAEPPRAVVTPSELRTCDLAVLVEGTASEELVGHARAEFEDSATLLGKSTIVLFGRRGVLSAPHA